jgi:hypothetical protein
MFSLSWRPKLRHCVYQEKPEWLPDWIYTEAVTAKRFYNEQWEFWVWMESRDANVSQAIAEDACIRGFKKALDRVKFVYGSKVAKWYREYLEMDDILRKVRHPEYKEVRLEGV